MKAKDIINWTEMDSAEAYMEIIHAASDKLVGGQTLAEWELDNFSRG
ncbi:MAG: hypothetical protein JJT77_04970 [Crocinitomicaceae bacterium]|nr:hypothetical protein [Crocinitomicaceae bacterium]